MNLLWTRRSETRIPIDAGGSLSNMQVRRHCRGWRCGHSFDNRAKISRPQHHGHRQPSPIRAVASEPTVSWRRVTISASRTRGAVPGARQDGSRESLMWSWIVLVLSGVLEAVWATALGNPKVLAGLAPLWSSYSVSSRVWPAWRTQCEACQWGPLMQYGLGLVPCSRSFTQ